MNDDGLDICNRKMQDYFSKMFVLNAFDTQITQ